MEIANRDDAFFLSTVGRLLPREDVASNGWDIQDAHPLMRYIEADYLESDRPNVNAQFWTADDIASSEHTIKHVPVNMLHRRRQPVGVILDTRIVPRDGEEEAAEGGPVKVQVLIGLWAHVFPAELAAIEEAQDIDQVFVSMECRGDKVHCAGDNGCGRTFDYMDVEDHCEHLLQRTSIRHIVSPTFRGCGIIIPPTRPGWTEAKATVLEAAELHAEQSDDELPGMSAEQWRELEQAFFNLTSA